MDLVYYAIFACFMFVLGLYHLYVMHRMQHEFDALRMDFDKLSLYVTRTNREAAFLHDRLIKIEREKKAVSRKRRVKKLKEKDA